MYVASLGKTHSTFPSVCKGRWNGEGNVFTDRQGLAWQLLQSCLSKVTDDNIMWYYL